MLPSFNPTRIRPTKNSWDCWGCATANIQVLIMYFYCQESKPSSSERLFICSLIHWRTLGAVTSILVWVLPLNTGILASAPKSRSELNCHKEGSVQLPGIPGTHQSREKALNNVGAPGISQETEHCSDSFLSVLHSYSLLFLLDSVRGIFPTDAIHLSWGEPSQALLDSEYILL